MTALSFPLCVGVHRHMWDPCSQVLTHQLVFSDYVYVLGLMEEGGMT